MPSVPQIDVVPKAGNTVIGCGLFFSRVTDCWSGEKRDVLLIKLFIGGCSDRDVLVANELLLLVAISPFGICWLQPEKIGEYAAKTFL